MKKLSDSDVVRIIREEWEKRVQTLREELNTYVKPEDGGAEKPAISAGLKVKHKKSGGLFTVDSVGQGSVVLREPEGRQRLVPANVLEKEFELA